MLFTVLSFVGWAFVPDQVTRRLLPIFHRFYQSLLGLPAPAPTTPLYIRHYRYVYAFTVFSYILYNFWSAATSMAPNYYELLGVEPTADENVLKIAFRQFARKYHPDRVGPQGETMFIEVRDAFEALKNPVTRYAYDRFGPEAITWMQCTTIREYVRHGLMQSAGFYIVSCGLLLLVSAVRQPSYVALWQYLLFAAVFTFELKFLLSPSPSSPSQAPPLPNLLSDLTSRNHQTVLALLWPRRVAYQHIRFLHSLFTFLSFALSRVAQVLFPPPAEHNYDDRRLVAELRRVSLTATKIQQDVFLQAQTELRSVHGLHTGTEPIDPSSPPPVKPAVPVMDRLTAQLEAMYIEGQLMDGGPLKSAVDNVVERRRRANSEKGRGSMPSPTPSPPRTSVQLPLVASRERSPVRRPQVRFDDRLEVIGESRPVYVRGRSQSY